MEDLTVGLAENGLIGVDGRKALNLNQAGLEHAAGHSNEGKIGGKEMRMGGLIGHAEAPGDGAAGGANTIGVAHDGPAHLGASRGHLVHEGAGDEDGRLRDAKLDRPVAALFKAGEQLGILFGTVFAIEASA